MLAGLHGHHDLVVREHSRHRKNASAQGLPEHLQEPTASHVLEVSFSSPTAWQASRPDHERPCCVRRALQDSFRASRGKHDPTGGSSGARRHPLQPRRRSQEEPRRLLESHRSVGSRTTGIKGVEGCANTGRDQAALTSMSGLTPSWLQARSSPVRPRPVCTSSTIRRTLCRRHAACT